MAWCLIHSGAWVRIIRSSLCPIETLIRAKRTCRFQTASGGHLAGGEDGVVIQCSFKDQDINTKVHKRLFAYSGGIQEDIIIGDETLNTWNAAIRYQPRRFEISVGDRKCIVRAGGQEGSGNFQEENQVARVSENEGHWDGNGECYALLEGWRNQAMALGKEATSMPSSR